MPVRATKRGAARTPLRRDCDVLICGASFAGLTLARELEGTGARVMMLDRYDVGERATSACAAPTEWLERLGLRDSIRQTFPDVVMHTTRGTVRWALPFSFSTFDYRQLCGLLRAGSPSVEFETATVEGVQTGAMHSVRTDRGELRAPLVVDGLGWRRVLSNRTPIQPPDARLSRGLEVHPSGSSEDLEVWIDPRYVRAGYSWCFPADGELRIGVGSFEPRDRVKDPTVELAGDLGCDAVRFQGNWIPHKLRPATEDGVFFVGDSAGHCLPLTAEGIRPAFYFALALGRELRHVLDGRATRDQALERYGSFSAQHGWQYAAMLGAQHLIGRLTASLGLNAAVRFVALPRVGRWAFRHYLAIAPPQFASLRPPSAPAAGAGAGGAPRVGIASA
ncbi:MAG TPA: FAD-dependent monooxygenase [Solirubrobacteraceae bacterium]|jgi:flavin-dependent dehydrogenase|nr:FAD-dependent monooxygenase [Solirubrobacteraceae bacterium]